MEQRSTKFIHTVQENVLQKTAVNVCFFYCPLFIGPYFLQCKVSSCFLCAYLFNHIQSSGWLGPHSMAVYKSSPSLHSKWFIRLNECTWQRGRDRYAISTYIFTLWLWRCSLPRCATDLNARRSCVALKCRLSRTKPHHPSTFIFRQTPSPQTVAVVHRLQLQAPWPLASTLKAASVTSAPASSSKRTDFDCAIADTRREWWELFETNEC